MKTKFLAAAGLVAALTAGGAAWAFSGGTPAPVEGVPTVLAADADCCVTGACCCPGQGACCDLSKRATAAVAKTLKKADGCCATGDCCCPGAGACCAASPVRASADGECCLSPNKPACCSK